MTTTAPRPHILLALIDDYGWANAGWHRNYTAPGGGRVPGTPEVATPHMDSLVRSGIELNRAYAYKYCSPSRSALQSGRDPYHVNVINAEPSVANRSDPESGFAGIPRSMTGIATKLASAGYATAMFGKWDAGMAAPELTPRGRGYQKALSYFHHLNDEWSTTVWQRSCKQGNASVPIVDLWLAPLGLPERAAHGYNNSCTGDQPPGGKSKGCQRGPKADVDWGGYEDALLAQEAIATIEAHDTSRPLFLFWAPHAVHTPLQVPQKYVDRFHFMQPTDKPGHERQLYSATVAFIDDAFANISAAFERREMATHLLVVMSADNGGAVYYGGFGGANNHPLRGGKMNNWEGGIRVNAFVSGGFLPAAVRGTRYSGLVALWDWYSTFCALAGVDPTDESAAAAGLPPIDSIDQSAIILGKGSSSAPPRTELALGTEPRATDLAGAPLCSSFSSAGALPHVKEIRGLRVERDRPVRLPAGGTCATLNGLIELDDAGHLWKLLLGDVEQAFLTGFVAVTGGFELPNTLDLLFLILPSLLNVPRFVSFPVRRPYFPNSSTPSALPPAVSHCGSGCLFDLTADPLEAHNLASRQAERVKKMRRRLEALLLTAWNPHRGKGSDPECCRAALEQYGGFYGPFLPPASGVAIEFKTAMPSVR